MTKIALVEVFASPQGEGYHAGRPAVFVRFAGCPLACEFAPGVVCDTPYQQANLKPTILELFRDIIPPLAPSLHRKDLQQRQSFQLSNAPMLILTGGEPTGNPSFDAVVRQGKLDGFYVAVESNGTRMREGLHEADWVCVSPKESVSQTSTAEHHNHNPQSPKMDSQVVRLMSARQTYGSEYRYVIGNRHDDAPPYDLAMRHYVSPAVMSNGSGDEWKTGFPGFVSGTVERCLEIITADPRWRLSIQQHKILGVR